MNRRPKQQGQTPVRHVSSETLKNLQEAQNIDGKSRVFNTDDTSNTSSVPVTIKTDTLQKANLLLQPEKREKKIIVRLTKKEYMQLSEFVMNHIPRTSISDVVRSGISYIIGNAK